MAIGGEGARQKDASFQHDVGKSAPSGAQTFDLVSDGHFSNQLGPPIMLVGSARWEAVDADLAFWDGPCLLRFLVGCHKALFQRFL